MNRKQRLCPSNSLSPLVPGRGGGGGWGVPAASVRAPPTPPRPGKEPKPRLSAPSGRQMARRKCLSSSASFPVRGKLPARVRRVRAEPPPGGALPVCGAAPRLGALPAWKGAWVFSYCGKARLLCSCTRQSRDWIEAQAFFPQLELRESKSSSLGSEEEARRAAPAHLHVRETGVQREPQEALKSQGHRKMSSRATTVSPLRQRSFRKYLDKGPVSGKIWFLQRAFAVGSLDARLVSFFSRPLSLRGAFCCSPVSTPPTHTHTTMPSG